MEFQARLIFSISGNFNPNIAARIIALKGAEIFTKGEPIFQDRKLPIAKYNRVTVQQVLKPGFELDAEARRFICKFPPTKIKKIKGLKKISITCEIYCSSGMDLRNCILSLNPLTLAELAKRNLVFQFEVYFP